jgi:thiol:disulfide interchange protein
MNPAIKPVWGLFFILLFVVLVTGLIQWLQPRDIVPWREDFEAAREESLREGKPMFAYFTADWCGPCRQMATTTWADAQVEAALQAYVPVRIDVDRNPGLVAQYRVGPIPYFVVLDENGEPVHGQAGRLSPEDFLNWLGRWN